MARKKVIQPVKRLFERGHFQRSTARVLPLFVGALLMMGGLLVSTQPVSAQESGPTQSGQICMQKVFGTPVSSSNRLNCTAGDIRLSAATDVSPDTCTAGETFTLTATFTTVVTANARYDAGFFFRTDGGANARGDGVNATGTCSLSALDPDLDPGLELDGDTCGDLNAGTYEITFTIPNVLCQDPDGDGFLNLPNCTSWHSNQGTVCDIDDPFTFDPDTKSKCVCDDTFQVPVTVEQATITVVKEASPDNVPETGGTVTYTVQITNDASIESVTISSIIDNLYGNLGTNTPPQTDNTCPDLIGDVLAAGATTSCSFKVFVTGNSGDTVTDIVEACVTQSGGSGDCDNDDADVHITDIFTQPTLDKTAQATANCQLDATYQVVVSNNSEIDDLTVNSLTDNQFGNVTQVQGNVLSTNCSVPQTITPLDNYTCSFVGRITSTSCDISHSDTVTGNVTDEDNITSEPSDSATVTVDTTP